VRQILTFSRGIDEKKIPVALGKVIAEGLTLLRPALPSTVEIRWMDNEKESVVLASPVQMHQVLMNLCTNAAHAMQATGGVLEIRLSHMHLGELDEAPRTCSQS
jgi:two-component system, cell cycle sensor histidine kinase and response regulator CckA